MKYKFVMTTYINGKFECEDIVPDTVVNPEDYEDEDGCKQILANLSIKALQSRSYDCVHVNFKRLYMTKKLTTFSSNGGPYTHWLYRYDFIKTED